MTGKSQATLDNQVKQSRQIKRLTAELNRARSRQDQILQRIVGLCGHPDAAQACRNVIAYCEEMRQ